MDPYKILGIDQCASLEEIEAAYQHLSHYYRPGQHSDPFEAGFYLQVCDAYEILRASKLHCVCKQHNETSSSQFERTGQIDPRAFEEAWKENIQRSFSPLSDDFNDEEEVDFTIYEYFFRWKFPVVFISSFFLIHRAVLSVTFRNLPSPDRSNLSRITLSFTMGGWFIFWIARFSECLKKMLNSPVTDGWSSKNRTIHFCDGRDIGNVFSFIVATAYAFFLYFTSLRPYLGFGYFDRGDGIYWASMFFGVFVLMTHCLEKGGIFNALKRSVTRLHKLLSHPYK
ncbi:MAG: DnaJ domain-containing protein [Synergistaceae bacterium]|jgi:hypothetical protein|nr:DnaJ domain-containing protein [Synergistaceae bacterium]